MEILRRIGQYVRRWKRCVRSGVGDVSRSYEWPNVPDQVEGTKITASVEAADGTGGEHLTQRIGAEARLTLPRTTEPE